MMLPTIGIITLEPFNWVIVVVNFKGDVFKHAWERSKIYTSGAVVLYA